MEQFNIIRNAVRCFCIKDNKVIALKLNENNKNSGFWDIPGGKIEDNETMEEAAIREFKEEAGLDITNPIYRGVIYVVFPRGTLQLNILIVDDYKGIPNTTENHVPGLYNIDDILYADKRYACTLILDPFYRKVLLDRTKTFEMIVHSSNEEVVSKVEFEIKDL